jgi:hypothetical protein
VLYRLAGITYHQTRAQPLIPIEKDAEGNPCADADGNPPFTVIPPAGDGGGKKK